MQIGRKLIQHRFARKWSQAKVAELTGMSQPNYSRIESDQQEPSLEQIHALAQVFEITPEELISSGNAPVFNSENQQGGYANNYFAHQDLLALVQAKEELIAVLKQQIDNMQHRLTQLETQNIELGNTLLKLLKKD